MRSKGAGQVLLDWIQQELRRDGIRYLFLESGIRNTQAHSFFKKQGFSPVSLNMIKTLT
jgi:N-acetylglutamate synthase-like GNAT family acetyltransferase